MFTNAKEKIYVRCFNQCASPRWTQHPASSLSQMNGEFCRKPYSPPLDQGLICSYGEEGMQLVQPSFYRQYWHARANWGYVAVLVTLSMSIQLLRELHALFSEGVYKPLVWTPSKTSIGYTPKARWFSDFFNRGTRTKSL